MGGAEWFSFYAIFKECPDQPWDYSLAADGQLNKVRLIVGASLKNGGRY